MAENSAFPDTPYPPPTISGTEHGPRSRLSLRRDKPQLSCNLCRKRKVRCDRQNPCSTCFKRGLARFCVYSTDGQESILPRSAGTVQERIHQLESLVTSLMQQDTGTPAGAVTDSISISDPPNEPRPSNPISSIEGFGSRESGPQSPGVAAISHATPGASSTTDAEAGVNISSIPMDGGYLKYNNLGTANYVGSSHWAAVLDSITELKEHFEQEEKIRNAATEFDPLVTDNLNWPQLLYSRQTVTKTEILSSIPSRRVVDRLVSRYFTLEMASGIIHSGQFLGEYDRFWEDPSAAPIIWVGLLFTIMCLGELHQHSLGPTGPTLDPQPLLSVNIFRERIVQCLILGKYTKGGPYVLESLIQYNAIEHFLRHDAEFEIWILLGMLIPISLRMGLHRDPKHFNGIPVFAAEMRRRVWATIFQIDVGFSALAGLPRMIKPQQCDTEEPRNLLDSDFDERTQELPPSRPESETTPVLFLLAKNRIITVGGLISDLAHDIRPYPYTELTRVEKLLQSTRNSLPPSLQWQPLSQSIIHGSQVIMQRLYLDIFCHRMQIILYKKYLSVSMTQSRYKHAREVCLDSAMKIIEYQHLLQEETQPDGRLSSVSWTYSSILNHDFMLAASVLCFYIKQYNVDNEGVINQEIVQKIKSLLKKSHDIWLQSSTTSDEAQKAVQSLSIILGITHLSEVGEVTDVFSDGSAEFFAQFNNPHSWPVYQDYVAHPTLPPLGLEATIDEYQTML